MQAHWAWNQTTSTLHWKCAELRREAGLCRATGFLFARRLNSRILRILETYISAVNSTRMQQNAKISRTYCIPCFFRTRVKFAYFAVFQEIREFNPHAKCYIERGVTANGEKGTDYNAVFLNVSATLDRLQYGYIYFNTLNPDLHV